MNNSTKTILWIVAAGAVGVAVGMLFAPEKGSDLRKSLKASLDDMGDKLNNIVSDGKEKVMDAADNLKTKMELVKTDVNTTVEDAKQIVS